MVPKSRAVRQMKFRGLGDQKQNWKAPLTFSFSGAAALWTHRADRGPIIQTAKFHPTPRLDQHLCLFIPPPQPPSDSGHSMHALCVGHCVKGRVCRGPRRPRVEMVLALQELYRTGPQKSQAEGLGGPV
ncbi:hypothetical protein POX_b02115 [Penicillium oxalicum]|uniref:hypothetical protein n=1 Tax=Penicillium oxalicum TaxID=69781 RepID=UPI0020B8EEED|nr:hypothetical protein POX_b02115 [Penicillium oxalicum]KAI2792081.1 hypothetical protein POX_b02115 [Penicillium oxalicum]